MPSGHKIWAIRTLLVSIAGLEASEVDVRLGILSPCEHFGAPVSGVEHEHPPVSAPLRNHAAFFLNEAPRGV